MTFWLETFCWPSQSIHALYKTCFSFHQHNKKLSHNPQANIRKSPPQNWFIRGSVVVPDIGLGYHAFGLQWPVTIHVIMTLFSPWHIGQFHQVILLLPANNSSVFCSMSQFCISSDKVDTDLMWINSPTNGHSARGCQYSNTIQF